MLCKRHVNQVYRQAFSFVDVFNVLPRELRQFDSMLKRIERWNSLWFECCQRRCFLWTTTLVFGKISFGETEKEERKKEIVLCIRKTILMNNLYFVLSFFLSFLFSFLTLSMLFSCFSEAKCTSLLGLPHYN